MERYAEYKKTGIEWIGEIPKHWKETRFKWAIDFQEGPGILAKDFNSTGVPLIRISGVKSEKVSLEGCNYLDENLVAKKWEHFKLEIDDILISCSASTDLVSEVDSIAKGAIAYTGLIRLRPKDEVVNKDFIKNIVRSTYYQTEIDVQKAGSIIQHYGPAHLNQIKIVLPPIKEQTQIANYLDNKTAEIDNIIAAKKKLIALYEEEKATIINQAVTKGVNPDVKLKPSGVEWLGDIPEHWRIKKLRYLCKITTGDKDTENREDGAEYPFFVRSQTVERISSYSYDGEAILTAGDGVGVCKVWHYINGKFDFHQRVYMMFDFVEVTGKYLFHFIKDNFIHEVLKLSAKSTVDSLRRPMFLDFPVAFPVDENEQNEIIRYLENHTNAIEKKISKAKKLIELLTEYRTTLISDVVTGKIKVTA